MHLDSYCLLDQARRTTDWGDVAFGLAVVGAIVAGLAFLIVKLHAEDVRYDRARQARCIEASGVLLPRQNGGWTCALRGGR